MFCRIHCTCKGRTKATSFSELSFLIEVGREGKECWKRGSNKSQGQLRDVVIKDKNKIENCGLRRKISITLCPFQLWMCPETAKIGLDTIHDT